MKDAIFFSSQNFHVSPKSAHLIDIEFLNFLIMFESWIEFLNFLIMFESWIEFLIFLIMFESWIEFLNFLIMFESWKCDCCC